MYQLVLKLGRLKSINQINLKKKNQGNMSRLNGIYPEKKYYKTQVRQTIIHQYTLLTIMMWGKNENNMQHLHEGTVGNEIQLARKKNSIKQSITTVQQWQWCFVEEKRKMVEWHNYTIATRNTFATSACMKQLRMWPICNSDNAAL